MATVRSARCSSGVTWRRGGQRPDAERGKHDVGEFVAGVGDRPLLVDGHRLVQIVAAHALCEVAEPYGQLRGGGSGLPIAVRGPGKRGTEAAVSASIASSCAGARSTAFI